MSGLYECERECGWTNDDFRYGLADAGMSWALHMDDHRRKDAEVTAREPIDPTAPAAYEWPCCGVRKCDYHWTLQLEDEARAAERRES